MLNSYEYVKLVKQTYGLIIEEIDYYLDPQKTGLLPQAYPNLVVLYEFFRQLRGEGFENRPPAGENQHDFYRMENQIKLKLKEVRSRMDPGDESTQFYIKKMQGYFSLEG